MNKIAVATVAMAIARLLIQSEWGIVALGALVVIAITCSFFVSPKS